MPRHSSWFTQSLLVCAAFGTLLYARPADAQTFDTQTFDYTTRATAASSCVGGCDSPYWTSANAGDRNAVTDWSSQLDPGPNSYEWFAFWFDKSRPADQIVYIPRVINGAPSSVPNTLNIYYSTAGAWAYLTTISNPLQYYANGRMIIPLGTTVNTNGFLLTTADLSADTSGSYYFQIQDISGSVHGHVDTSTPATAVMTTTSTSLAYFFNTIKLGESEYLATFHAEGYQEPTYPGVGDSIGAKCSAGPLAFGLHTNQHDLLATRSVASAPDFLNGTANPNFLKVGANWVLYWIEIHADADGMARHYMDAAYGWNDANVAGHDANYSCTNLLSNNAPALYFNSSLGWSWLFPDPALPGLGVLAGRQITDAGPVGDVSASPRLHSTWSWNENTSNPFRFGLIGSMTTGDSGPYFFYTDNDPSAGEGVYRRPLQTVLSYFGAATRVAAINTDVNPYVQVHFHENLNRYVVLYPCGSTAETSNTDVCLQTFATADLKNPDGSDLQINKDTDAATYGIHLTAGLGSTPSIIQFGVRKDPYGRHVSDADGDLIVYATIQFGVYNGQDPWGATVYAKQVFVR